MPHCGQAPLTFRSIQLPKGFRLVSLREAAAAAGVGRRTMFRHAADGNVWGWRLFMGKGPWRIVLDAEGLPADPPGVAASPARIVELPPGFRHVSLKEAADAADVSPRTMNRHAADGNVWAWRLFKGKGPWRVVMDNESLPADPPYVATVEAQAEVPQ